MDTRPSLRRLPIALLLSALCLIRLAAQDAAWLGLWKGSVKTPDGEFPAALDIFPGGALLDLPDQGAFGWPAAVLRAEGAELHVSVELGSEPLEFSGTRDGDGAAGTLLQGESRGAFSLRLTTPGSARPGDRSFDTGRGVLPGTLVVPEGLAGRLPLVVLLPDSGTTDRDGNNWQVPGRNDVLRLLADALSEAGIASYRYDKRGAGRAYGLGGAEGDLVFEDHVKDAAACLKSFEGDERFSAVLVLGLGDGALVGAAALREARADAFAAFGVSGKSLRDMILEASFGAPEEYRVEIVAVLGELEAGRFADKVSPFLEGLFRRSFQPYLASWLKYTLGTELARLSSSGMPVLLIQGDLDLQVTMEEFDRLRAAVPAAEAVLLPETNHILKQVGNDVDENYASFSDPSFPLSPGIVPALQDFLTRLRPTPRPEPAPGP